jgi:hypothetical protein
MIAWVHSDEFVVAGWAAGVTLGTIKTESLLSWKMSALLATVGDAA